MTTPSPLSGPGSTSAATPLPRVSVFRRYPRLLATIGLALVVVAVVVQGVAIAQASAGNWERGTLLAWIAIGASALAFCVGVAVVVKRRTWRLGLLVVVLSLLLNPYLLSRLLDALG